MMDFNLAKYCQLLQALIDQGFLFQTFNDFVIQPQEKVIILRHDVDLLSQNSLATAKLENKLGIKGSYYFRAVQESWDVKIINEIAALGHEVGYHYESLTACKGDIDLAIDDFKVNLNRLRLLAPVNTICMHGSPRSEFDSKDLWKHFNYRDFGIIGEPYFDIDFNKVLYLTDTGRRWDGYKVSVRDKVEQTPLQKQFSFHCTQDIIDRCEVKGERDEVKGERGKEYGEGLPSQIMITVHPQRWSDKPLPWLKELVIQNVKNVVKRVMVRGR